MEQYHKIQTVYGRDPENKYKTVILGQYSKPEFAWLSDNTWIGTEKIDGTNIRIMWDGDQVRFGGKTDNAQIPTHLLTRLQDAFTNENLLSVFDHGDVCLYGEGYGEKIQNGGAYMVGGQGVDFILFDVNISGIWLERKNVDDIAGKLAIDSVPCVFFGSLLEAANFVGNGFPSSYGDRRAEGLVIRPEVELFDRLGDRIITKIKTKDFADN